MYLWPRPQCLPTRAPGRGAVYFVFCELGYPMGEGKIADLRVRFDGRIRLERPEAPWDHTNHRCRGIHRQYGTEFITDLKNITIGKI